MFNRDGLFGKKDDSGRAEPRNELRPGVNVAPALGTSNSLQRPAPQPVVESPRPDLRFAETAPKPQTTPKPEEPAGSRLIVGPDIKLRGVEITDCDTLVVEGRVEASMDSRVVQIAESGVFAGTVSIDFAEIRGRFEGELTARKQLIIYATGKVSGRIRYGTIRIEEGGEVSGEISTLAAANAPVLAGVSNTATSSTASTPSPSAPATSAPTTAATPTPTPSPAPAASSAQPLPLAGAPRVASSAPTTAPLPEVQPAPVHVPHQQAPRSSKNSGKTGAGVNTA